MMSTVKACKIGWVSLGLMMLIYSAAGIPISGSFAAEEGRWAWSELNLSPNDRLLILAPHPDDEILACAGVIQKAVAMGLPIKIVFLTYGDKNQWSFVVYRKHPVLNPKAVRKMGMVRRHEAIAASSLLGLSSEQLVFLGYPDFGTLKIWNGHWGDRMPFLSASTRTREVPYPNAMRPGAPYKGEEILKDLVWCLREFRPTKVFVSHPADQHPDHQALYLFTRVALWDLERELKPQLYAYLIHFKQWPKPSGCHREIWLEPPGVLGTWRVLLLTPPEVEQKEAALKKHWSQYKSSARYFRSFVRCNELFEEIPTVALETGQFPRTLSQTGEGEAKAAPEQLTEEERMAFVGFEEKSVRLEKDRLVFSMTFSKPLAEAVGVSLYVFGFRRDCPFSKMPKLHIQAGALAHAVYDGDRPLPQTAVQIQRGVRNLTIQVPLKLVGDPEKILTSARTYLGNVPLDWVAWRTLELLAE
jgi:LmbE family N-acetylglucosaminyl deacetylase